MSDDELRGRAVDPAQSRFLGDLWSGKREPKPSRFCRHASWRLPEQRRCPKFLPGKYQGTYIDTRHTQIEKLIENTTNPRVASADQRRQLELLRELNEGHRRERDKNAQIEARIQSFELASRMQLEAAEAFDISREPESIRRMYGDSAEARTVLIARRLAERGVRFVQAWVGNDWDHHQNIEEGHRSLARKCDQAIGALLKLFFDFLQRVKGKEKGQQVHEHIERVSADITDTNSELETTSIMLAQVNADNTTRGSASPSMDADVVGMISCPPAVDPETGKLCVKTDRYGVEKITRKDEDKRRFSFGKNRMGKRGGDALTFNFNGATQTFS